ncbi:restriction endonuclease [Parvibaculum sp.]|uniref:restriction endonuclease n=1 Tax=Parvibaculum sp. TaxID=2024848 RepID=UPI001B14DB6D|nr:restriction endonuclease [Parvibaculum sp.]MBO6669021.1 restriction endonuclease [Parvibaculum sp.]MBO6692054.1 restriction endonuclease [Parvibaculum sp.]MBO6715429.1 restriction endonuclease [Parvibaculum sp.]
MATIDDIPKLDALLGPTIEALKQLGGSASNDEIHDKIVELMNLPEDVVEIPHDDSGSITRLRYRMNWTRSYLKHVGALENTQRGVWTLTSIGRNMTPEELADVPRIVRQKGRKRRKAEREVAVEQEVNELENELVWNEQLLSVLLAMPPDAFERLCQRVLREAGFTKVEVTGRSGDGGIDGNGVLRVNLISFQVIFQCKRYSGSVGSSVVRDFRGAMVGRADKGLIMTTGRFTADARKEAIRDGAPAIDLVDGDDLCELLKSLKIGVKVKLVEEVEIDEAVFASI